MKTAMTAIIRKDFRGVAANKQLFTSLLVVPLVLTVLLPSIFMLAFAFAPEDPDVQKLLELLPPAARGESLELTVAGLLLNFILPVFFLIIPIMTASVMAASAFVGEKEKRTLETLLERYQALSENLTVEKVDPVVSPTFLEQYDVGSVYNNSLIVESEARYRYVDYYDIYEYDYTNYYTTGSVDMNFAGEGAITSAVSYVVNDDLPKVYTLTGHGEGSLSSDFQSAAEQDNVEFEELSLLSAETVPEDADCVLILAPQSDIADVELTALQAYLDGGGRLLLITDPPQEGAELTNLETLMAGYGVHAADGIVVEEDQANYAMGLPYYLLPDIGYHTITSPLRDEGYYVLLPIAQGLTVDEELPEGVSVTELLTTSANAFSKAAGWSMTTYEREEGDADGPFALAVAATKEIDDEIQSQVVWVSSSALVDDETSQRVAGGNQDFFLNCISWMCEQEESISIRAKSLSYEYLTMDSATASQLGLLITGVLPLGYFACGIVIWVRRKRR